MPKPPAEPVEYDHHYTDVPGLGSVIFSSQAMDHLARDRVGFDDVEEALAIGFDVRDDSVPHGGFRQYQDLRLVLRTRPHMKGAAAVCIDGYRVKP